MSTANTLYGWVQSGTIRNTFPTQTIAATTETQALVNTDAGTTQAFLVLPTGGSVYGAQAPLDASSNASITRRGGRTYGLPSGDTNDQFSISTWDGRPFSLRLSGIGNAGANAAQSILVNLYAGTSTTVGSNTEIATTGAALATVAGGAFDFEIEARLLWDNTLQSISGSFQANINFAGTSQFTTWTTLTNNKTSVTAAGLSFIPTFKLGNAASSTFALRQFYVEAL